MPLTSTRFSASTATRLDRANRRVQIVGDHDHGQAQIGLQLAQQCAKFVRAGGVQAGGGFIQQQQWRVHDQRPRQRHALDHAAGQIGRVAAGVLGLEAHHLQLDHGRLAHHGIGQAALLAQGKGDVVQDAERRVQRPVLKQHAHAGRGPGAAQLGGGAAQGGDPAFARLQQPQNLPQQHGFAGARAANDGQHFAPVYLQV